MRGGVVGLEGDRLCVGVAGRGEGLRVPGHPVELAAKAEAADPRRGRGGRRQGGAGAQAARGGVRGVCEQGVRAGEDLVGLPARALGPDGAAGRGVDEAQVDLEPVAGGGHAAVEDERRGRGVGAPRAHPRPVDPREPRLQGVREVGGHGSHLGGQRVAGERLHGDGGLRGRARRSAGIGGHDEEQAQPRGAQAEAREPRGLLRRGGRGSVERLHGTQQAVAPAALARDVPRRLGAVPERLAQEEDAVRQRLLRHVLARPDGVQDLLAADEVRVAAHQEEQQLEGARGERDARAGARHGRVVDVDDEVEDPVPFALSRDGHCGPWGFHWGVYGPARPAVLGLRLERGWRRGRVCSPAAGRTLGRASGPIGERLRPSPVTETRWWRGADVTSSRALHQAPREGGPHLPGNDAGTRRRTHEANGRSRHRRRAALRGRLPGRRTPRP